MNKNSSQRNKNSEKNNEFLESAISDLAGNLSLVDTKISIILATIGVILGLVVACKSNILKAYCYYAQSDLMKVIFIFLVIAYVSSVVLSFVFGIKCIMIRFGKSNKKSLWFFKTEKFGGISEKDYLKDIRALTDEDVTRNLAIEVYKLNDINNSKMKDGKKTIVFFAISCMIIAIIMILVGLFYLFA